MRCLPDLPAAPQLPGRDPREGMLAQWLGALPEVRGRARRLARGPRRRPTPRPSASSTIARTRACSRSSTSRRGPNARRVRVKAQVTGPSTLGIALHAAGSCRRRARSGVPQQSRACGRSRSRSSSHARLPDTGSCCSSTSPRSWRGDATRRRSIASRRSTCCRARSPRSTASPACTCAATATSRSRSKPGPRCSASRSATTLVDHTVALARFLDGDGWIAWGAVPTDRPVGESADPHWRALATRLVRAHASRVRSGAAAHTRGDHPGVRAGGLRCLASRAGARHRTRVGRPGARPGRRGPTHAGSLKWRPPRTATAVCAVSRSKPGATVCGNCGAAVDGAAATR